MRQVWKPPQSVSSPFVPLFYLEPEFRQCVFNSYNSIVPQVHPSCYPQEQRITLIDMYFFTDPTALLMALQTLCKWQEVNSLFIHSIDSRVATYLIISLSPFSSFHLIYLFSLLLCSLPAHNYISYLCSHCP